MPKTQSTPKKYGRDSACRVSSPAGNTSPRLSLECLVQTISMYTGSTTVFRTNCGSLDVARLIMHETYW